MSQPFVTLPPRDVAEVEVCSKYYTHANVR